MGSLGLITMAAWAGPLICGAPAPVGVGFIENLGQYDSRARFVAEIAGGTAFLTENEIRLRFRAGASVFLAFEGATPRPTLLADDERPGLHHFYRGNDPSRWVRCARGFGRVTYREMYPGIDVCVRLHDGTIEYDVLAAPGADVAACRIRFDGVDSLAVKADGSVVASTPAGEVRQRPPRAFVVRADGKGPVGVATEVVGTNRISFRVPTRREETQVVVDPTLVFSTFLGGSENGDSVFDALVADDDSIYLAARCDSMDFPITPGAFATPPIVGNYDAVVTRLAADGASLVFSARIGGAMNVDTAASIALAKNGAVVVAGSTSSLDFPTTPGAYSTPQGGPEDAFVLQLSSDGSTLIASTCVGGLGGEGVPANGLALDGQGRIHIAGSTNYLPFPTTPDAYFPSTPDPGNGFLAILSPDCASLLHSTYIGCPGSDQQSLALDGAGGIFVAGRTSGPIPSTPGAFDPTNNNGNDAFVVKFKPMGQDLRYATYLGSSGPENMGRLASTTDGKATVAGLCWGADFPATPGSFDPTFDGINSLFVSQLNATGSALVFSGFVGATFSQVGALKLDPAGGIHLVGRTDPSTFEVTPDAYSPTPIGEGDLAFCWIDPTGSKTIYGTYFGGTDWEQYTTIAVNRDRRVAVVGRTQSFDLPVTPGVFQPALIPNGSGADSDPFIAVFDLCNGSLTSYGNGCPGHPGGAPVVPTLTGTGCPAPGGSITVAIGDALGNAPAVLFAGTGQGSLTLNPWCALQVAPLLPSFLVAFALPPSGALSLPATLPVPLPKTIVNLQLLVGDPSALGGIAASAPLAIAIGD